MKHLLFFYAICLSLLHVHAQEISYHYNSTFGLIENKGQWPDQVAFQTHFNGGKLWVEKQRLAFHFMHNEYHAGEGKHHPETDQPKGYVMAMELVQSSPPREKSMQMPSKQYYNYFIGNDTRKWVSDVRSYSEGLLPEVYPNIDWKFISEAEQLKYEFIVHPGGKPEQIQFQLKGITKASIQKNGDLVLSCPLGKVVEKAPKVYQIANGNVVVIPAKFILNGDILSYSIGKFNPELDLIIDPDLIFATYSGSVTDNFGMTATYDYNGHAYSGGIVYGNGYPTPDNNAYDTQSNFTGVSSAANGITDVFISKFSPDGTQMLWTTFLGGGNNSNGTETVHSLIVNQANELYLFGATSSLDFPIVNGFQNTHAGGVSGSNYIQNGVYFTANGTDLFVAKLSENGHDLLGSTYIGGSGNDGVNYKTSSGTYNVSTAYDSLTRNYGDQFRGEIMIDQNGDCIVASCTRSADFPTVNAVQPTIGGLQDGVVFRLNSDLSQLLWSTYVGGSNNDALYSVKIDSSYNVVVAGGTSSTNVPDLATGVQPNYGGGKADGFIKKFNSDGSQVLAGTYLGTAHLDQIFFVEIDRNDNIFVLGQSEEGAFPVINSGYVNANSSQFIAKLNDQLSIIEHSTTFGNGSPNINISPSAFLVDICGNLYISGWGANILQNTPMGNMPVTNDAYQSTSPNGFDFYLMVLHREFNQLLYGTYMGGPVAREHVDGGTSRFDKNGVVYQAACGGCPGVSDFPTTDGAYSNLNLSSNCNTLLFKFDFDLIPHAEFTTDHTIGCTPFTVEFQNFSSQSDAYLWNFGNGDTSTIEFNPIRTFTTPGVYDVWLYVTDSICLLTDSAMIQITVDNPFTLNTSADELLCTPVELTLQATASVSGVIYEWSTDPSFNPLLAADPNSGQLVITPNEPTTYYVRAYNTACSSMDSIQVNFIGSSIEITGNTNLCKDELTTLTVISTNPQIQFNYTWSPNEMIASGQGTSSITVIGQQNQWFVVEAANNLGCEVIDSIWVQVSEIHPDSVNASANPTMVYEGGTVELLGTPQGMNYLWTPMEGVAQPNAPRTNAKVENTTIYTLIVTDGICTKSDTVMVKTVPYTCEEPYIFVPNSFSPNGDGQNDVLYVMGPILERIDFKIFDRWGELVFETISRSEGWDGTYKGRPLEPDVYDYYLKVDCMGGLTNILKGNITLMR